MKKPKLRLLSRAKFDLHVHRAAAVSFDSRCSLEMRKQNLVSTPSKNIATRARVTLESRIRRRAELRNDSCILMTLDEIASCNARTDLLSIRSDSTAPVPIVDSEGGLDFQPRCLG
jgi:hypothetical protein